MHLEFVKMPQEMVYFRRRSDSRHEIKSMLSGILSKLEKKS